jgi:hypothetical protein
MDAADTTTEAYADTRTSSAEDLPDHASTWGTAPRSIRGRG